MSESNEAKIIELLQQISTDLRWLKELAKRLETEREEESEGAARARQEEAAKG